MLKEFEDVLPTDQPGLPPERSVAMEIALCRKAKFNCPLPGSPSGRPLMEAPNRAVLANSWNGYEGYLII
jgi:hypothetical protein